MKLHPVPVPQSRIVERRKHRLESGTICLSTSSGFDDGEMGRHMARVQLERAVKGLARLNKTSLARENVP